MDTPYRLKIKIGQHEFDAEGPADVVQEQFKVWKEIISSMPSATMTQPQLNSGRGEDAANVGQLIPVPPPPASLNLADAQLDRIMRMDSRVISLTARAQNVDDAVLLLLYGQKIMRGNDAVSGFEVIGGLTATGGYSVSRPDRILDKLGRDGDVIVIGERRSRRYRLTNTGIAKARQIAADLIATVA